MKSKKEGAAEECGALEKLAETLDSGAPARQVDLSEDEWKRVQGLGLLSAKPIIYAANVEDGDLAEGNEMVDKVKGLAKEEGASVVTVSAQVEAELVDLDAEERMTFLEELGVAGGETGLQKLIVEVGAGRGTRGAGGWLCTTSLRLPLPLPLPHAPSLVLIAAALTCTGVLAAQAAHVLHVGRDGDKGVDH